MFILYPQYLEKCLAFSKKYLLNEWIILEVDSLFKAIYHKVI